MERKGREGANQQLGVVRGRLWVSSPFSASFFAYRLLPPAVSSRYLLTDAHIPGCADTWETLLFWQHVQHCYRFWLQAGSLLAAC